MSVFGFLPWFSILIFALGPPWCWVVTDTPQVDLHGTVCLLLHQCLRCSWNPGAAVAAEAGQGVGGRLFPRRTAQLPCCLVTLQFTSEDFYNFQSLFPSGFITLLLYVGHRLCDLLRSATPSCWSANWARVNQAGGSRSAGLWTQSLTPDTLLHWRTFLCFFSAFVFKLGPCCNTFSRAVEKWMWKFLTTLQIH